MLVISMLMAPNNLCMRCLVALDNFFFACTVFQFFSSNLTALSPPPPQFDWILSHLLIYFESGYALTDVE